MAPPTDDDVAAVLARVLRQARKDFADADAGKALQWDEGISAEGAPMPRVPVVA